MHKITLIYACERKWNKISQHSLQGETEAMIPEYELLYPQLKSNPMFLYNYAAELHAVGRYKKSIQVLHECKAIFNDYDLQMLIADNYFQSEEYILAQKAYQKAHYMCPNRFLPLDGLVNVFDSINQPNIGIKIAQEIIEKPIKIPSYTVFQIKAKMQKKINQSKSNK